MRRSKWLYMFLVTLFYQLFISFFLSFFYLFFLFYNLGISMGRVWGRAFDSMPLFFLAQMLEEPNLADKSWAGVETGPH